MTNYTLLVDCPDCEGSRITTLETDFDMGEVCVAGCSKCNGTGKIPAEISAEEIRSRLIENSGEDYHKARKETFITSQSFSKFIEEVKKGIETGLHEINNQIAELEKLYNEVKSAPQDSMDKIYLKDNAQDRVSLRAEKRSLEKALELLMKDIKEVKE